MKYLTQDMLRITVPDLNSLVRAKDDDEKNIVIDALIDFSNALVDLHIKPVYPSMTKPPLALIKIASDLAIYYIYQRLGTDVLPKKINDSFTYASEMLQKIASGELRIFGQSDTVGAIGIDYQEESYL